MTEKTDDLKFYLETDRLILRDVQLKDALGMLELNSDPEVQKYVGGKPISTIDEAMENINFIRQQYIENGIGRWAVIEKESGNFIGWAGLKLVKEMNNHCNFYDLGYRFIPKYWGKGYATETAKISIKYAFEKLKLKDLYASTHVDNLTSKHVLEKAGFQFIEVFNSNGINHNWLKLSNS